MARRQRHHDYQADGDDDDEHQPSSVVQENLATRAPKLTRGRLTGRTGQGRTGQGRQARQAARADRAGTTGRTGQQGTRVVATCCSLAQHAIRLATGRSFSTHGPPHCWPATARRSSMAVFHASCALSTPAASGSCTAPTSAPATAPNAFNRAQPAPSSAPASAPRLPCPNVSLLCLCLSRRTHGPNRGTDARLEHHTRATSCCNPS
ncbi:hypothetical protein COCMIDRAFT_22825 [Bipolaris oryzae ATCC 44560]|uniref:Uncharacterized protein n=1 Tax=Bipolaris oryzae ATCC 44560 TaxID=930090 RepID=W6ZCB5_COCMI|nr:uncharacterized protein COCMIDRAFT_22825 [Bipolaris oryzae ATCC 44560]EUC49442.1 hypothetical protein COCMIDRAFT_22825 [Bipolaris oryzae ATCC 44560]